MLMCVALTTIAKPTIIEPELRLRHWCNFDLETRMSSLPAIACNLLRVQLGRAAEAFATNLLTKNDDQHLETRYERKDCTENAMLSVLT